MTHRYLPLFLAALLIQSCSGGNDQNAPEAAAQEQAIPRVYIVSPADGETVTSPVNIEFGIEGFTVAPAGTLEEGTGHHHLLIDTELPPLDAPIPANENHIHFGKGQTSATIELEPGEHTLQLLLGDGNHVPHSTALISDPVKITVTGEGAVE